MLGMWFCLFGLPEKQHITLKSIYHSKILKIIKLLAIYHGIYVYMYNI